MGFATVVTPSPRGPLSKASGAVAAGVEAGVDTDTVAGCFDTQPANTIAAILAAKKNVILFIILNLQKIYAKGH
jgi:hypothetical protein